MSSSAPADKKKKISPRSSLSSLPDEVALSCLARVSRWDYGALSLVSKTLRSLIASQELYKTRSLFGCTETCLYISLLTPPDPTPRWFILSRKNRLLRPIPSFPSQPTDGSSVVVLDWGIYVIGGVRKRRPLSTVLLLDCGTHTWRELPSMGVGRCSPAVGVVDGKIYVFGGCWDPASPNWAEVFDPKTQTWEVLPPIQDRATRCQWFHTSFVVREEKIYGVDLEGQIICYSPREGKWRRGSHGNGRGWCVVGKYAYCCDNHGNLRWSELESEPKSMYWRIVQGLLECLKTSLGCSRLVNFDWRLEDMWEDRKAGLGFDDERNLQNHYSGARLGNSGCGGKILLFWDAIDGDCLEIRCAEVSLDTRQRHGPEIRGIEWSHAVKTLDPFLHHYKLLHSVSVTL